MKLVIDKTDRKSKKVDIFVFYMESEGDRKRIDRFIKIISKKDKTFSFTTGEKYEEILKKNVKESNKRLIKGEVVTVTEALKQSKQGG